MRQRDKTAKVSVEDSSVSFIQRHIPSLSGEWKQLYQYAMLELDDSSLAGRISVARRAILDRAEELLTKSSGEEHRELNDAVRALRILEQVAAGEQAQHNSQ
jgi:inhibitor of KinA sporulation pathway (predicted exonuclease)